MLLRLKIFSLILGCVCCLVISIDASAKEWRRIVPLHSTRADVKRLSTSGQINVDRDHQ